MTTKKQAQSSRNSGNNAAMQRLLAQRAQCPRCERKQAMVRFSMSTLVGSECKWCGYTQSLDFETGVRYQSPEASAPDLDTGEQAL